ncbi:MAG: hypothetical protein IPK08_18655 [Bacteroidetes bacterium]|nr:hypothetical protein [Bacteroidota bacterium]
MGKQKDYCIQRMITDSIENKDQWCENNPELDVDSMVTVWTDRVNFLNQTATNINLQREGIISNNLENAELQNDYVVGDIVPYSNNSYINEREIAFLESGNNLEEVTNYYSEILSIAQQCPLYRRPRSGTSKNPHCTGE